MDLNRNNPIITALRNQHITPEYLAKIARVKGISSIDDFLAQFEPKQPYKQVQIGAGEGTSASEVEHYIDMSGNNQHNPAQYDNPIGLHRGGSPHNAISKSKVSNKTSEGGDAEDVSDTESTEKLPTGIKKKSKTGEKVDVHSGGD